MCFASSTSSSSSKSVKVPAKLTLESISYLDVDIKTGSTNPNDTSMTPNGDAKVNGVNMTGTAGNTDLAIESIIIENNNEAGKIQLVQLEAKGVEDWNIVSYFTDFASMNINSKNFGILADGEHDMLSPYEMKDKYVTPGNKAKITLVGKTGISSESYVGKNIGELILTIGIA
jgi:hypothetical protein